VTRRALCAALAVSLAAVCVARAQSDKVKPREPVPEAQIAVTSTPPGATIYVGPEGGGTGMHLKGVTPATVPVHSAIEEDTQRYRVTLCLPGHDTFSKTIALRRGDLLNIDAQLDPRCKAAYVRDGCIWCEGWDGGGRKSVVPVTSAFSWDPLAWSPNGRLLAYVEAGEVVVADVARCRRIQVSNVAARAIAEGAQEEWQCGSPVWSPDNRRIAYIAHGSDASVLLVSQVRVTPPEELPGIELPVTGADIVAPVKIGDYFRDVTDWQPSHSILAAEDEQSRLLLITLNSSLQAAADPVAVQMSGQAAWSPDGSRLAFASMMGRVSAIYVADAQGNSPLPVVQTDRGLARRPTWSPDGEWIAYMLEAPPFSDAGDEVHLLSVAGAGEDTVLYRGDANGRGFDEETARLTSFTPDGAYVLVTVGDARDGRRLRLPVKGGAPEPFMGGAGLLCYSSGLESTAYRSLPVFTHHLWDALQSGDPGLLGDMCMPVLEKVDSSGKLVEEVWEKTRQEAVAKILRNVGPTGVEQATQAAYTGDDSRFQQVIILGGSGRKLFLRTSDKRWWVAGYYLSP